MMINQIFWKIITVIIIVLAISCEDPYTPPTREDAQLYIVEGYIESGDEAMPTYVMVTKSIAYTEAVGPSQFAKLFVKDAKVVVFDGSKKVNLQQICTSQLPPQLRAQALAALGLNSDSTTIDICLYVDLLDLIEKKEGGRYDLTVTVGDKVLTATTTIPRNVPITNFRWDDPPGAKNDTMARLWVKIADPVGPSFYRYMTTDRDIEELVAPQVSVQDDAFFDGKNFEFPLQKAEAFDNDIESDNQDFDNFGLFERQDSFRIKWMSIDKEHFDFWNTRDNSAVRNGPFASYIRIKSNIKGGLGIWGGYSVNNYTIYCPPK